MRSPVSALGSGIGSRISDGCQSAQMDACQLNSVAVGNRTCASADYFHPTGYDTPGYARAVRRWWLLLYIRVSAQYGVQIDKAGKAFVLSESGQRRDAGTD